MIARRMKTAFMMCAVSALFTWGMLLVPDDGFARAGRGQSYRSSSSSSRSYRSSSSSSSRSYSSSRSSRSTGYHSYSSGGYGHGGSSSSMILGIILLAGFIIGGYFLVRHLKKTGGLSAPGASPVPAEPAGPPLYETIIAKIRETDPEFSHEKFLARAGEIFFRLQSAWSSGDMAPVRNYLSQGVYNRYRIQLEIMRDVEGVKNLMAETAISWSGLAGLDDAGVYQTLHVMISASGRDAIVAAAASDEEVKRALASAPVTRFTEVYSFTRKRGARTDAGKDWLKGQCPSCGFVPDNFSQVNKCPSCGSIYNSGEYDWVLSEITQSSEWHAASAADVPGLAELGAANLSMNRQVVEDRASYLFWRWIQARVRGDAAPLARDASRSFRNGFTAPSREYLGEVAVGAVDLKLIGLDGDTARSQALVLWSASPAQGASPVHHEHSLTLSMPTGLENRFGLADHGCNKCGGPLPDTDALSCAYCGAPLPEANDDWLLEHVTGG